MPIELAASTTRSTYFAGESITLTISISNLVNQVNRYFQNANSASALPSSVTCHPNQTTSPYGSVSGIPSINQMKNASNLTPNNSSINLLADAMDINLQVGNEIKKSSNKKFNKSQIDNTSTSNLGSITPNRISPKMDQMLKSTNSGATVGAKAGNYKTGHLNHNLHLNTPRVSMHQHQLLHGGHFQRKSKNVINTLATNCAKNDQERVAWVSVYMHCECNVNKNKVALQNISAALVPVKSMFSHDFEATSNIGSHLFGNDGFIEKKENEEVSGFGYLSNAKGGYFSNLKNSSLNGDGNSKSTDGTDSGVGGVNSSGSPNSSNKNFGISERILPKTSLAPDRDSTGICVLQTPPQILLCDHILKPGENKKLIYREKIPVEAPPSYSGSLLRYSYKLTVSVQRVGGSIRQIKIPFRVLVLYGLTDYQGFDEIPLNTNPFLDTPIRRTESNLVNTSNINTPNNINDNYSYHQSQKELSASEHDSNKHNSHLLDMASDLLNRITVKRRPLVYKIANSNGVVGTFCMPKTSYRLGEDIVGIFDFCGDVPCVQLETCLQMEEIVVDDFKKRSGQPNSVISFHKQINHCLFTKKQAIVVPIPLHVSPEFMTEIVILKWRLHFEFVTGRKPLQGQVLDDMAGDTMWQGPFNVKTSGMSWDLPVKILPTVPALAESVNISDRKASLCF